MTISTNLPPQAGALSAMARALADGPQPHTGLQGLATALAARIGYRLFTVLVLDRQASLSRRYFSSRPDAYPPGGAKPIREDSDFFARVVQDGKARICADRAACVAAFPDHELIRSLGCESAVNVPVRWNGQTIASLNLLHEAGWYRADMLAELDWYGALAIPVVQNIIQTVRQQGEQP
ncbi:GAF domain-containing protein [Achromobacter sp. LC458]|uniref:GAF domain-containing protein n=1 Tax=Achromobacter sp. LC458 TaxID=1120623 RepID=UPI0021030031|nr:GAF domain-containing protein [Achromobacter sp. LC458]